MRKTLIVAFVMGFCGFIGVRESAAQTIQVFMLIPSIKGESTDDRHKDWINVMSIRHTTGQVSGPTVSGATSTKIPVKACEVEIVKFLDKSGPLLWLAAVNGNHFTEVRIEVVKNTNAGQQKVYEITLEQAIVSSISTANEEGAFPIEKVVLAASRAVLSYIPVDAVGNPQGAVNASIDCGANKAA